MWSCLHKHCSTVSVPSPWHLKPLFQRWYYYVRIPTPIYFLNARSIARLILISHDFTIITDQLHHNIPVKVHFMIKMNIILLPEEKNVISNFSKWPHSAVYPPPPPQQKGRRNNLDFSRSYLVIETIIIISI